MDWIPGDAPTTPYFTIDAGGEIEVNVAPMQDGRMAVVLTRDKQPLCRVFAQSVHITQEYRYACKFCGWGWNEDRPCEMGHDPETYEPYHCGNQECPMCHACQGRTDINEQTVRSARECRAIKEGKLS